MASSTTQKSQPERRRADTDDGSGMGWLVGAAVVGVLACAFPALLLAIPCVFILKRSWTWGMGLVAVGAVIFGVICATPFKAELKATKADYKAGKQAGGINAALGRVAGHLPTFWLLTLPLAPAAAMAYDVFRPRKIDEKLAAADDIRQKKRRRAEQTEVKCGQSLAAKVREQPNSPIMAAVLSGEPLVDFLLKPPYLHLDTSRGAANLHMLLLAGSGAGKTVSMLRLAACFATTTTYPIFFINPKNDDATKDAFYALMRHLGRSPRLYPDEPFHGWQGDMQAIHNRILAIPAYGTEGGSAFYAEMAEEFLWLALESMPQIPRSFPELVAGLDYAVVSERLEEMGNDEALRRLGRIDPRDAGSVVMRFTNMARKLDTIRADGWTLDEADAGYIGLNVLGAKRDIDATIKFLLEDLKHFFAVRKRSQQRVVVFVDEFGALGTDTVITLMEMIRSLGGILVLATQTQDSLGDPSQQRRILGNVTTILQQMNLPEELVKLGGTMEILQPRLKVEKTHIERYDDASATRVTVDRVDTNAVQRLTPGQAFIINKGRAVKVQMVQPPQCPSMAEVEAERGIERERHADDEDDPGIIVDGHGDDLARLIAWHGDDWRTLDPVAVIHTLTVLPPTPPAPIVPPVQPKPQDDPETPLPDHATKAHADQTTTHEDEAAEEADDAQAVADDGGTDDGHADRDSHGRITDGCGNGATGDGSVDDRTNDDDSAPALWQGASPDPA